METEVSKIETQPRFAVSLVMTPELNRELQAESSVLAMREAYLITGTVDERREMAKLVNAELQRVKGRITYFKEKKAGFVAPAKTIIANAESLFDPTIKANTEFETYLKGQLLQHQTYEQRLIEDARRAREESERAARQKAEQDAAAARARAEEQAAAARKAAQDAEAKRQAALAEGNQRAAQAAAAEKAKQEEKANAALESGEAKATEAILAASAQPVANTAPEPTVLKGFSSRDNWVDELAPGFDEAKALEHIVAAIAGVEVKDLKRRDLLALLVRDPASCKRLAKALKSSMSVPGLVAVNRPIAASRAA